MLNLQTESIIIQGLKIEGWYFYRLLLLFPGSFDDVFNLQVQLSSSHL